MIEKPPLSNFSKTCLDLTVSRFPEFAPHLAISESAYFIWASEIPWPSGDLHTGIRAATHKSLVDEEYRIDIGNWHAHFGDYGNSGSFEFLEEPFALLTQFFTEELVLVMGWVNAEWSRDSIERSDYRPNKTDIAGLTRISVRSWRGTYDREWFAEP